MVEDELTLATDIAKCLGPEWHAELGEYARKIQLSGPEIGLLVLPNEWGYKNRWAIYTLIPAELAPFHWGADEQCEITVNPARGGGAFARDIERRLLPKARLLLDTLRARKRKGDEQTDAMGELMDSLTNALGLPRQPSLYRGRECREHGAVNGVSVAIEAYVDSANLELRSLPPDLARAICALIKNYREAR